MHGSTADLARRTPGRSASNGAGPGAFDRKGKDRSRSLTRGGNGGSVFGAGTQIDEERAVEGDEEEPEWDDVERRGGMREGAEGNGAPAEDEEAMPGEDILSLLSNVYRVKMGK